MTGRDVQVGVKSACGRWSVVAVSTPCVSGRRWMVACTACGAQHPIHVRSSRIAAGRVARCRRCQPALTTTYKKEFRTWVNMRQRCYYPRHDRYEYYGGRGITVCDRWLKSFAAFFQDVGPAPYPRATIDRIDPNKNYQPDNVRWASYSEQNSHLNRYDDAGAPF